MTDDSGDVVAAAVLAELGPRQLRDASTVRRQVAYPAPSRTRARLVARGVPLELPDEVSAEVAGATMAEWLRCHCLDLAAAPEHEWALVDVCVVEDHTETSPGEWWWTFVWTHVPTGVAVALWSLAAGSASETSVPSGVGEFAVVTSPQAQCWDVTDCGETIATAICGWAAFWVAAPSLEELAFVDVENLALLNDAVGVTSSPVVMTPSAQRLAALTQLAAAPDEGQLRRFVDFFGQVPVREEPWVPTWPAGDR